MDALLVPFLPVSCLTLDDQGGQWLRRRCPDALEIQKINSDQKKFSQPFLFQFSFQIIFPRLSKRTVGDPLPASNIRMASARIFGLQMLQLGQDVKAKKSKFLDRSEPDSIISTVAHLLLR